MEANYNKFKEMVHLVIHICKSKKLGAVRLNKILWFSDKLTYRSRGESISGTTYVRRERGPVPSLVLKALDELKKEKKVSIRDPGGLNMLREFGSLKEPNRKLFSKGDVKMIKTIAEIICDNTTADEISELSHDDIWRAAGDGEEMPLAATLVSESGDFREEVMNWANSAISSR